MADFVEFALADEAKLRIWRDKQGLGIGRNSVEDIAQGLERSRTVISIITQDYLNSAWCMGEFFTGVSYNNFIAILADEVSYEDIPFDRGTTTAIRFSELQSVDQLQGFCKQVYDRGRSERSPRGLSGFPLYEMGEPALVLNLLWGTAPLGLRKITQTKRREQLLNAVKTIENSTIEGLKKGLGNYSKAAFLMVGLDQMEATLLRASNASQEWLALAHLARPFNKRTMNRAFERAGITEDTMRTEFGISAEELPPKRLRRRPRPTLSEQQKRVLRAITPVTSSFAVDSISETGKPTAESVEDRSEKAEMLSDPFGLKWRIGAYGLIFVGLFASLFLLGESSMDEPASQNPSDVFVEEDNDFSTRDTTDTVTRPDTPASNTQIGEPTDIISARPNDRLADYCQDSGKCTLPDGYTLWQVSLDCFETGERWEEIYNLNNSVVGDDPDLVQEGATITVQLSDCMTSTQKAGRIDQN